MGHASCGLHIYAREREEGFVLYFAGSTGQGKAPGNAMRPDAQSVRLPKSRPAQDLASPNDCEHLTFTRVHASRHAGPSLHSAENSCKCRQTPANGFNGTDPVRPHSAVQQSGLPFREVSKRSERETTLQHSSSCIEHMQRC